ncbi:MAG: hypothetical protein FD161_1736 [Limisphaerales bacterium]|nr:MAG: hypothetical protein FD161_1736 [Limisphaerales bacterium]KAG0509172.1 MAG: hypothetical protein E1N63_1655 [Limisphaerales bacterium]TXT52488.1 MAG: hypothetical protein FD140_712 [Limisphaerales bacterium]
MIARNSIQRVGFVTLTFAENLTDYKEAQRRLNSFATHVLRNLCTEWITAVERQARGAIHYHLCAVFTEDIRTGFNFEACWAAANERQTNGQTVAFRSFQRAYFQSANAALRRVWDTIRAKAPLYGFGRCETLPVRSNTQAVARYVGAYVGKEAAKRDVRDKGMRSVRYSLEERKASARFSWVDGAGKNWRLGCSVFASFVGSGEFREVLGDRWAWSWREVIGEFGRHFERACELLPAYLERSSGGFLEHDLQSACLLALRLKMEGKEKDVSNP